MLDLMLAAALMQAADPCNAVTAAGPPPSRCPAWRSMYRNEDREMFVDPGSIRRSGDTFEILHRLVFTRPLDGGHSAIVLYRYDCRAQTIANLYAVFYDARGVAINRGALTGADAEPITPAPDSSFGRLLAEYCPPAESPRS